MNRFLSASVLTPCVAALVAGVQTANAIVVPQIPGLEVTVGQTVMIQQGKQYPEVFQFADGRLSVGWYNLSPYAYNYQASRWSYDGGHTWVNGTGAAPRGKASIELGGGEVLSLGYEPQKRADGKLWLHQQRSLNGWNSATDEVGVYTMPRVVPSDSDAGIIYEGGFIGDGLMRLKDGRLMASWFGNYDTDTTPGLGYPPDNPFRKYRQCVIFSSDEGRTWGSQVGDEPVTVATCDDVPLTQEGLSEGELTRAPNGDILMAMRSGGTLMYGQPTPLYLSRSTDEGKTWSDHPQPILDRGTSPSLVTMSNGVIVCTTSRPGNWLLFSQDNGYTWKGAFQFDPNDSYNSVFEVAPNEIMVVYVANNGGSYDIMDTFFTVKPIPEPGTVTLIVTGGICLLAYTLRKKKRCVRAISEN